MKATCTWKQSLSCQKLRKVCFDLGPEPPCKKRCLFLSPSLCHIDVSWGNHYSFHRSKQNVYYPGCPKCYACVWDFSDFSDSIFFKPSYALLTKIIPLTVLQKLHQQKYKRTITIHSQNKTRSVTKVAYAFVLVLTHTNNWHDVSITKEIKEGIGSVLVSRSCMTGQASAKKSMMPEKFLH